MDSAPVTPVSTAGKATPRDFFLWLGAVIALYGSVSSLIALLFAYINRAFPDPLAGYADPYGGDVRFYMATLFVLVPTTIILLRIIRKTIEVDPSRATLWVRRWALVLTIFVAGATVLIDLITLINYFLGGEISMRFMLKVAVVLLVALGISLHFLADLRGYWILHPRRVQMIGIAAGLAVLLTIVAGFFIIGSPQEVRALRYDEQKVSDLQSIQYQIVNYWQQKEELPASLAATNDSLSGFTIPRDPQTGEPYVYEVTGETSFKLCANFNQPTPDTAGQGEYPMRDTTYPSIGVPLDENWLHETGQTCFDRTIDPERYPPFNMQRGI